MSAVYLIGSGLPIETLKIIEEFLIAYQYQKHSWAYLCEHGKIDGLKWLKKHQIGYPTVTSFHCAVELGHLDVLKWLMQHYPELLGSLDDPSNSAKMRTTQNVMLALQIAACQNSFRIVKWIVEEFHSFIKVEKSLATTYAAENGNLEMLQWLHEKQFPSSFRCIDEAAANGHLHILKWYAKTIPTLGRSRAAIRSASENGHLDVLQWFFEEDETGDVRDQCITTLAMDCAAANGMLNILQWMQYALDLSLARCCTVAAMNYAAENGNLEVVQWLHENRDEGCTPTAMDRAAANGHLDMVQWLHAHRSEGCTVDAMDSSAENGHFTMVEWLHQNRAEGCTFRAIDYAAENGHFTIVRWLFEHRTEGCSEMALLWAAQKRHFRICQWLIEEKHCSWSADFLICLAGADGFELILWCPDLEGLLSAKEDQEQFMCELANNGNLYIFQWLYLKHPKIFSRASSERCILIAIGKGHKSILEFLFKFGRPSVSLNECFIRAIISNQLDILEWLCASFRDHFTAMYGQLFHVSSEKWFERWFIAHWLRKFAPKYLKQG